MTGCRVRADLESGPRPSDGGQAEGGRYKNQERRKTKIPRARVARGAPGQENPRADLKGGRYKAKESRQDAGATRKKAAGLEDSPCATARARSAGMKASATKKSERRAADGGRYTTLNGGGFGGEVRDFFGGLAAGFGVGGEDVVDGGEAAARRAGEDALDEFGNAEEWKAIFEEGGDSDFVGGVQSAGQGAALFEGFAGEAEAGETARGGFLEIEATEFGPVELDLLQGDARGIC